MVAEVYKNEDGELTARALAGAPEGTVVKIGYEEDNDYAVAITPDAIGCGSVGVSCTSEKLTFNPDTGEVKAKCFTGTAECANQSKHAQDLEFNAVSAETGCCYRVALQSNNTGDTFVCDGHTYQKAAVSTDLTYSPSQSKLCLGNMDATGSIRAEGLSITGDAFVCSDLLVKGETTTNSLTVCDDAYICGNVCVADEMTVYGTVCTESDLHVESGETITYSLTVCDDAYICGDLYVGGAIEYNTVAANSLQFGVSSRPYYVQGWDDRGIIQINNRALATSCQTTALGAYSATNATCVTAIGYCAVGTAIGSTIVGSCSSVSGCYGVAIGHAALGGIYGAALGSSASAGCCSTAVGTCAFACCVLAESVGVRATAYCCAVAIGYCSCAWANAATSIGYLAQVKGDWSVGIGYNTRGNGNCSVAVGTAAIANGDWTIAIGTNAYNAGGAVDLILGADVCMLCSNNGYNIAIGANQNNYSTLNKNITIGINVCTGFAATSLNTLVGSNMLAGGYCAIGLGNNANLCTCAIRIGTSTCTNSIYATGSVAIGDGIVTACNYSVLVGAGAVNTSTCGVAAGYVAKTYGVNAVAIGYSSCANTCAVSVGATANTDAHSVVVGYGTRAQCYSVAVGCSAITGTGSVSVGASSLSCYCSTAVGYQSCVYCSYSTAVGACTSVQSGGLLAIGANAHANCMGALSWSSLRTHTCCVYNNGNVHGEAWLQFAVCCATNACWRTWLYCFWKDVFGATAYRYAIIQNWKILCANWHCGANSSMNYDGTARWMRINTSGNESICVAQNNNRSITIDSYKEFTTGTDYWNNNLSQIFHFVF